MNQERINKLESVSRNIISKIILEDREIALEFWIVTITKIKISSDLSYLDVHVSSIKNWELLTKYLAKKNNLVERVLWKEIQIRKLPKVRYRYDKSWEIWQSVCNTILQEANRYL